jgi:hypothetical protein
MVRAIVFCEEKNFPPYIAYIDRERTKEGLNEKKTKKRPQVSLQRTTYGVKKKKYQKNCP